MSREILFRGKTVSSGEWVYGYFVYCEERYGSKGQRTSVIIDRAAYFDYPSEFEYSCTFEIDLETVGQWTGLVDKNGRKIFEGDLLSIDGSKEQLGIYTEVIFKDFMWECVVRNDERFKYYMHRLEDNPNKYEVIGNIHDNPELLKREEE